MPDLINLGALPDGTGGDEERDAWAKLNAFVAAIPPANIAAGTANISVLGNAATADEADLADVATISTRATVGGQCAVRGPATSAGAPNTTTRLSVGNLRLSGGWATITPGVPFLGQPNYNQDSPVARNALEFGSIWLTPRRRFLIANYVRARQESSLTGDTTGVYRISPDGGNSWGPENVIVSAASASPTATAGVGALWSSTQNGGRLFQTIFTEASSGAPWVQSIVWSDNDGVTWSSPVPAIDAGYSLFWLSACRGLELPDGLGPNGSGTLLLPGYGQNTSNAETDCTILSSTDGGATWGHYATVFNGVGHGVTPRYVEMAIVYLGSGNMIALLRRTDDSMIATCFSTDSGKTWGSITDAFAGVGKPATLLLQDGTLCILSRSTETNGPAFIRTSHNGGVSWEPQFNLDERVTFQTNSYVNAPRQSFMAYGDMTEVSPGVVALSYGAAPALGTFFDQTMTYLLTGYAQDPFGNANFGTMSCGKWGMGSKAPIDPPVIRLATAADMASLSALGAYINSLVSNVHIAGGQGLSSPLDVPGIYGLYESLFVPAGVNSVSTSFTGNFNLVNNIDTLAAVQEGGATWSNAGNHCTPATGTYPTVIDWTANTGDLLWEAEGTFLTGQKVGITFRGTGSNTDLFAFYNDGTGKLELWKNIAGTTTKIDPGTWTVAGIANGQTVGLGVSCKGSTILISVDPNVGTPGSPSYTQSFSYALSFSESSTFSNANVKFGLLGDPAAPTSYTYAKLNYNLSVIDTVGYMTDQCIAAGVSNPFGNISQATANHRFLYYQNANRFKGQPVLLANSGTVQTYLQGSSITPRSGPQTYVLIGYLQNTTGASRGLYNTGTNADTLGMGGTGNEGFAASNNGTVLRGPLFNSYYSGPIYPQGEFCHAFVSNGPSSKLYRDGRLIQSGSVGTNAASQLTIGDAVNPTMFAWAHFSAYAGELSQTYINELARYGKHRYGSTYSQGPG